MENKNGQGIFYGVIGVATLIVAIIGATFAFFSAQASTNYVNEIAGNTLDISGALSVSVTKVTFAEATADSDNLVPAKIAVDGSNVPTTAGLTQALGANCEKNGYTGCHVYKIEASSSSQIDVAEINLKTLTVTASEGNKSDWKYVIYKGTDSSASSVVANGSLDLASAVNMHANDKVLNATPSVYYLMIYLAEDENSTAQNADGNDSTGSYTGTVELTAGSGHVTANFTA